MTRVLHAAIACMVAIAGFNPAQAGVTTNVVEASVPGIDQWGSIQFIHSGGALTIDMLANSWNGGPSGFGIDDAFLTLLVDDGSSLNAFTGDYVTENDDSSLTFADGSTSALDSFIELASLPAGPYLLTVSHCCIDFDESGRDVSINSGIHQVESSLTPDFQVTFSTVVEIIAVNGVPVPEAASVWLLAVAALCVGPIFRRM